MKRLWYDYKRNWLIPSAASIMCNNNRLERFGSWPATPTAPTSGKAGNAKTALLALTAFEAFAGAGIPGGNPSSWGKNKSEILTGFGDERVGDGIIHMKTMIGIGTLFLAAVAYLGWLRASAATEPGHEYERAPDLRKVTLGRFGESTMPAEFVCTKRKETVTKRFRAVRTFQPIC